MSVEFLSGKPGAGKSLLGVDYIVRELVGSARIIVTNLPLKLADLNAYLQSKYPDLNINLHERVQMLDDEHMVEFYRYRGRDRVLGMDYEPVKKASEEPKPLRAHYEDCEKWKDRGVFYVLDELHLFFNSRRWMQNGLAAMHYLSQHRKMGDDVLCITQFTGNVDRQFRSVAQEFHQIRNLSKEKWGIFRGPPRFKVVSGLQELTNTTGQDLNTRFFPFRAEVASLYDTAAGVGILGAGEADKGTKAKGIPFSVLLVVLGLVGLALATSPIWIRSVVQGGANAVVGAVMPPGMDKKPPASAPSREVSRVDGANDRPSPAPSPTESGGVYVSGFLGSWQRGRVTVYLSDGRVFDESSNVRMKVDRNGAVIAGVRYPFVRPEPKGAARPSESSPFDAGRVVDVVAAPVSEPPASSSSWRKDADGVQRLTNPSSIGKR